MFGDDWIGSLSANDIALIKEHGPRGPERLGPVARCPSVKTRNALDKALGRELRLRAQRASVFDLIRSSLSFIGRHSLDPLGKEFCDVAELDKMLAQERAAQMSAPANDSKNGSGRGPGAPPIKTAAAAAAMIAEIERGRMTLEQLLTMTEKAVEERFNVKRAVAISARKKAVANCRAAARN